MFGIREPVGNNLKFQKIVLIIMVYTDKKEFKGLINSMYVWLCF